MSCEIHQYQSVFSVLYGLYVFDSINSLLLFENFANISMFCVIEHSMLNYVVFYVTSSNIYYALMLNLLNIFFKYMRTKFYIVDNLFTEKHFFLPSQ